MKRRSEPSDDEPAKAQRRKTAARKSRITPKAVRPRSTSTANLETEVARLARERDEALEQQTATSEVLSIIRRSPADAQPVFDAIVQSAARLCGAIFSAVYLYEDDHVHIAATNNFSPEAARRAVELREQKRPDRSHLGGRAILDRAIVHVPDVLNDPEYSREWALAGGWRAVLAVPLLRDGKPVGAVTVAKAEPKPFSDRQVQLLNSFADQALIAIENVRLFDDVQKRTQELTESLQQQTATADVLKVISRSTFDLQSVLNTLVESAARLCEADFATIHRQHGDSYPYVASYGLSREYDEYMRERRFHGPGQRGSLVGRVVIERRAIHVHDAEVDPEYTLTEASRIGGFHTLLGIPLLREGEPIGVIVLARNAVRPFNDKQIELATTFADQAVIAIENVRLFEAEQQRTRELTESLEQQTATSEVLQVISSSPGELELVFETMLENAIRLCQAKFGSLFLYDGEAFRAAAVHGVSPAYAEARRRGAVIVRDLHPNAPAARVAHTKEVIHVADATLEQSYVERDPRMVEFVDLAGARSYVMVPMLKESRLIGAIGIYRQEVRPFTDKQIELVANFAAQAVIAIENTRLLNELRESLQQQTATADVLKVISRSTFDLQMVLDTLVESAARLCEADIVHIARPGSGGYFWSQASFGVSKEFKEEIERVQFQPGPDSGIGRTLLERAPVHILDVQADASYTLTKAQKLGGYRTVLCAPMLRGGEPIGVFALARHTVRPFTERQIELLATFADQAVIAIENARLLNELRQRTDDLTERTDDLTEALEQQTATANVLKVISSSPGALEPVFKALLENATRLCGASYGNLWLCEGDAFRSVALHGVFPATFMERWGTGALFRPEPDLPLAQAARTKQPFQIADIRASQLYRDGNPAALSVVNDAGTLAILNVPMLKENDLVGAIAIHSKEARPFTDKQIELLENFASQAVIAIENARLLNELRQRTDELGRSVDELRALGEVSQAVNSTLDLETVLTTIVGRAVQLSGTDAGAIYVFDEERKEFRLHATYGMSETMIAAITDQHIGPGDTNIGAAAAQRKPIQVPDIRNEPSSPVNEIVLREGYRGILIIPLLRPDHIVGALVVRRKTPGEFANSTIDLLQTFADQSVVAIQNARLFESVDARTRELAKSLEDLRTAQDRLIQTEKLASLGQLTAGIAHEIKNPLNFVNNFSSVSAELIDELRETLDGIKVDHKARTQIAELTDTLRANLDKVVQHGKRADAIVKNMLLHSRQGSGEHRPVDINALVDESLNLAYHGARAEKQGFNITLERSFDPNAGEVDLFPQEITRALLNLISNGFYATTKRKAEANGGNYEPTLAAATKNLGDRVEIRIRDNGTGIPPEVREKLFNPFFTTKPAGEGTGLGLSISHDIIVKQHGGSIEVDTEPGEFTEFRIVLPRAGASLIKSGERA